MNPQIALVASFTDEEMCIHAVEALKHAGIRNFRVFAPIPSEHLMHAIGRGKSPLRAGVLAAGITGIISGLVLAAGTSMEWNLVTGGKPIVSMPPFIIIMFELMILFGAITSITGFLFTARMPHFDPIAGYNERFSGDRFGIAVDCPEADRARIEPILREAGAEEVVSEASPGQILVTH